MPAILNRLSILFINYISRTFNNTKIFLYKLFVWYMAANLHCKRSITLLIARRQIAYVFSGGFPSKQICFVPAWCMNDFIVITLNSRSVNIAFTFTLWKNELTTLYK